MKVGVSVGVGVGATVNIQGNLGFLKEKFKARDSNSEFRIPRWEIQVT